MFLIPGLEVTEPQQSHYTIHLQSEIAPSPFDRLLVTAVAWERLLLSSFSTFGGLLFSFASVKCHLVLLSILPFFVFPTPNLDRRFFPIQIRSSRADPTPLPKSKNGWTA